MPHDDPGVLADADDVEERGHQPVHVDELNLPAFGLPRGAPRPRSVRLAWSERNLKTEGKGSLLTFTLPRLEDYEMIVVR